MYQKVFAAAVLGALGLLGWAGKTQAEDVMNLKGGADAPVITLKSNGQEADTVLTRGGHGHSGHTAVHHGAAVRVGSVGVRVGSSRVAVGVGARSVTFRRRPVVIARTPVVVNRRPFFAVPRTVIVIGGVPYYYPYYDSGYGYGYGSPVLGTDSYYGYSSAQPQVVMPYAATTTVVPAPRVVVPSAATEEELPLPTEGTYDYDGGPVNPVPAPRVVPAPTAIPAPPTPAVINRQVSLPARQAQPFAYQAYGEQPAPSSSGGAYLASTSRPSR